MLLYIGLLGATRCNFSGSTAVVLSCTWLDWFPDAHDVEQLLHLQDDDAHAAQEDITQFMDRLVNIINTTVPPDGSNAESAPPPQTHSNICNQAYTKVTDFNQDLAALVATCQHQIRSSAAYCLCIRGGQEVCHFGYPKPLQWRYLWFNKMVQSQS